MLEWIIIGEDSGKKLMTFLTERLGNRASAKTIKRVIDSSGCQVNGKIERFSTITLKKKDYICFDDKMLTASHEAPKIDTDRVLYEDENLLAYNKPPGVSCDPKGILRLLHAYNPSLLLVHRLDKETSGVILLAKNQATLDRLIEEFKQLRVNKVYWAIADGVMEEKKGTVKNHLGRKAFFQGQTIWGSVSNRKGVLAHTNWEKLKQGRDAALVACYPITGRMHQIRVHLAEMGHPILGDHQYSKQFLCGFRAPRYLLHALQISFKLGGKQLVIKAPVPDDFTQSAKALGLM